MKENKKTVFLIVTIQAKINFILRNNILQALHDKNCRIIVISPFSKQEWFIKEFGFSPDIIFEFLDSRLRSTRIINNFRAIALSLHNEKIDKYRKILDFFHRRYINNRVIVSTKIHHIILWLMPKFFRESLSFWDKLERIFIKNSHYDYFFEKYHPDIVVTDNPNSELVIYAQRNRVPAMLIDINFDALIGRYAYEFRPILRKIFMQGNVMLEEAKELHGLSVERIPLIGSLRYNFILDSNHKYEIRDKFFKDLGIDSSKKLIFYATVDSEVYQDNVKIIKLIIDAINSKKISEPAQLLVSYGLGVDSTPYEKIFEGEKNIVFKKTNEHYHQDYLANILHYSDVVVSVASSINIEASILGTPSLWICFGDLIEQLYEVEYLKKVVRAGGVFLVNNEEEVIKYINRYLLSKKTDQDKRDAFIKEYFYKPDGKTAERIADLVSNFVPSRCAICSNGGKLKYVENYNEYSLWRCEVCCGQFWSPMKGPGNEWYEKDDRYSFRNKKPLKSVEKNHKEFLRDLPAQQNGRLLDVGMGTGNFLSAAIKKGYDGWGIDFDRDAIETAKKVFNLNNVYSLDIDGAIKQFGVSSFNVVTMFEVVEHLENPADFMGKVKQLLRSGGYLALSVPYRNAADFLTPHDKPPRHLTRWDEKAMKIFLESCGFKVMRSKVIPVSILYLITKFHFWFKGLLSFGLVQKISEGGTGEAEDSRRKQALKLSIVLWLAKAKDYILFFLPAIFLKLYLLITGQNGLTLYVLAKYEK